MLDDSLAGGLAQLKEMLTHCSTTAVCGYCFAYLLKTSHDLREERDLVSPAKQVPFLLGVLLATPEPQEPGPFTDADWLRATRIISDLFTAYMRLYVRPEDEAQPPSADWYRSSQVAMMAFFNYLNNGVIASVEQIKDRLFAYSAPFDAQLKTEIGISVTDATAIADRVAQALQRSMDTCSDCTVEVRNTLLDLKRVKKAADAVKADAQERHRQALQRFEAALQLAGTVSVKDLVATFPGTADIFLNLFSTRRGEGPEVRYPTERSIAEVKPLINGIADRVWSPLANGIYVALLLKFEEVAGTSKFRDEFYSRRDATLEREVGDKIRPFVSSEGLIWRSVYEAPDAQFEHDLIVDDPRILLIIEAKASPPITPFRDPEKAFVRLQRAFRADTGIQKGYEQASRVVRRLRAGETVALYDRHGKELGQLVPKASQLIVSVCVTRDNFGGLATNLSLLLEKDPADEYPWVINILDLANLGDAWSHFGWGSEELRRYLACRIQLHGKVMADDELDFAGYFIRHGALDPLLGRDAQVMLDPTYSAVFDQVYRHLHLGEPPVVIKPTPPIETRMSRLAGFTREQAFTDLKPFRAPGKVGRNKRCPCGSGKKFKFCHGAPG